MNEYDKQSEEFLKTTGTTLTFHVAGESTSFIEGETNQTYRVTIKNHKGSYTFIFNDSVYAYINNIPLSSYSILACLSVYDHSGFEDFCNDFGYEQFCSCGHEIEESRRIYNAVKRESSSLINMFTEEQLELLSEIQ